MRSMAGMGFPGTGGGSGGAVGQQLGVLGWWRWWWGQWVLWGSAGGLGVVEVVVGSVVLWAAAGGLGVVEVVVGSVGAVGQQLASGGCWGGLGGGGGGQWVLWGSSWRSWGGGGGGGVSGCCGAAAGGLGVVEVVVGSVGAVGQQLAVLGCWFEITDALGEIRVGWGGRLVAEELFGIAEVGGGCGYGFPEKDGALPMETEPKMSHFLGLAAVVGRGEGGGSEEGTARKDVVVGGWDGGRIKGEEGVEDKRLNYSGVDWVTHKADSGAKVERGGRGEVIQWQFRGSGIQRWEVWDWKNDTTRNNAGDSEAAMHMASLRAALRDFHRGRVEL
ncbi:hypothetical protein CYMTET_52352 [Cymbomonas tetramitiformis]|uniref:Uncharacterized protein n=1 Tax=Cymbomonas tetramitiformis TaxID=36881 RepID=A0AAE0BJ92_9CHLO|nr:hypothetical protein CYMTET_52352 [Cymbomonas tetramitiformis]